MNRKLCFFDIDNTLARFSKDMNASTKSALMELKKNGHYIFVNTGRTAGQLAKTITDFPFDGFVVACGSSIIFQGNKLTNHLIDKTTQTEIIEDAEKHDVQLILEGEKMISFLKKNNPTLDEISATYQKTGLNVIELSSPEMDFQKFCCFPQNENLMNEFIQTYEDRFEFIHRTEMREPFYEVVLKGCSKGNAIKELVEYFNLTIDDCYAFGDSANDMSMLSTVTHSICMENGEEYVKAVCEFVTHSVDDDGIEFACKHYHLI